MVWTMLCLALCVLGLSLSASAREPRPRIITIDVPGAGTDAWQGTEPFSINPAGAITGVWYDTNSVMHGFLRAPDGAITEFDVPGAQGIITWSINPAGAITGYYWDANSVYHGFLRAPHGKVTTFDAPGAGADPGDGEGTYPMSINADGTVAGYFLDTDWLTHGFSRSPDGRFKTFDVPGAGTDVYTWEGTYPISINPVGEIAGFYVDANWVFHSFLRAPEGRITTFDAPGHGTIPDTGTCVFCWSSFGSSNLNPVGEIAGFVVTSDWVYHGYVRAPHGAITEFDVGPAGPGYGTLPASINPEGAITGYYLDANFLNHGFLRDKHGTSTVFDVPGAATGAYQGTIGSSINPSGAIAGWYLDANNVIHGYLRIP